MSSRGTHNALTALEQSIKDGNYYEALQLFKTVARRFTLRKNYAKARELMLSGSKLFLTHKVINEALDLSLAYVDLLVVSNSKPNDPIVFDEIRSLNEMFDSHEGSQHASFLKSVLKWVSESTEDETIISEIRLWLAKSLTKADDPLSATNQFIQCTLPNASSEFFEFLIRWSATGFQSEHDLYFVRAVLLYASMGNLRDANVVMTKYLAYREEHQLPVTPLLNFTRFLLLTLEHEAPQVFTTLRETYKPSIDRDPEFNQFLDAIAERYYHITPRGGAGGMQNLMGTLMRFLQPQPTAQ